MSGFINRIFRGLRTPSPQAEPPIDTRGRLRADISDLEERVQRLEIREKKLLALVETHYEELHVLRGKVYGREGGRPPKANAAAGGAAIAFGDKDALRQYAGLGAGRRYKHDEEG